MLQRGLRCFSNDSASTFPPNIPGLPPEVKAREILGYVDNSYLLIGLRFGIIGCTFFSLLIVTSIGIAFGLMRSGAALLTIGCIAGMQSAVRIESRQSNVRRRHSR